MVGRLTVFALMALFVGSMSCATICPDELQSANRGPGPPDHSCCPQSDQDSAKLVCVETHFVGVPNFAGLDVRSFMYLPIQMDLPANDLLWYFHDRTSHAAPPEDLLANHHVLRI